ncbi:MAG TPA: 2Fe-2S iron-sulfur cluster-binding protein, partial [bacterium]|nr:2Fe-2S iron-sulfur cluster-binding protein [bacterium]
MAADKVTLRVWRGNREGGGFQEYQVELVPGMVVLDALRSAQATQAPDLAIRWNCKAGKCGSCSAEVNGHPVLTCMTRLEEIHEDGPVTVAPMKTFPLIKDLVAD